MAGFGETIERASRALEQLVPEDDERDWTVEAATYLALAYLALKRLEQRGLIFKVAGKAVVFPALERVWQELIHLRVKMGTVSDIPRAFTVTKIGRVKYEYENARRDQRRHQWHSDDIGKNRERDVVPGYQKRNRSRLARRAGGGEGN